MPLASRKILHKFRGLTATSNRLKLHAYGQVHGLPHDRGDLVGPDALLRRLPGEQTWFLRFARLSGSLPVYA